MTKKMKKQGGFTLVEMLIVVAIIAILIAVSIPLVSSSLEKAREATDAANERSFKAALTVAYLTAENLDENATTGGIKVEAGKVYAYDIVKGAPQVGEVTNNYGQSTDCKGKQLFGKITTDGSVYMTWDTNKPADDALTASSGLISDKLIKTEANGAGG